MAIRATMAIRAPLSPSQCTTILGIPTNAPPVIFTAAGNDFIVAENHHVHLDLTTANFVRVRDTIVLGYLAIRSPSPIGLSQKPTLQCRALIISGKVDLENVKVKCACELRFSSSKELRKVALQTFSEWMDLQREDAQRRGLRSLLV